MAVAKRLLRLGGVALLILIAVIMLNTVLRSSRQVPASPRLPVTVDENVSIDANQAAVHLASAIRKQTIASATDAIAGQHRCN